jgi:hypothetical protein
VLFRVALLRDVSSVSGAWKPAHLGLKIAPPVPEHRPAWPVFPAQRFFGEIAMMRSGLLGAAAMLAAVVATPALAQEATQEPGAYAQAHPWANDYYYGYGYRRPGFWPGELAADVIGGAIGTADAIVSAPFRGSDSYAYYGGRQTYDDPYAYYGGSYGYYSDRPLRRSTTTCGLQPGATYMGPDGRWYPC